MHRTILLFLVTTFFARATVCATVRATDAVTEVHVINSCHLDVGFKDTAISIMNLYFRQHIPQVVRLEGEFRDGALPAAYTPNRLNFMFQSWIMSMYFDCPPGLGLVCPTDQEMNEVALAIHEGDITHAFPHNAQYSLLTGSSYKQAWI